jgi:hypothetical protein
MWPPVADRPGLRLIAGTILLLLLLVGTVVLAGGWHVNRTYRHVVVKVWNLDDSAQVFVNCELVRTVEPRPGSARIDLGWLSPDDRIYLSSRNEYGDAAWAFRIISNGRVVFRDHRGRAGTAGVPAAEHAVVMAQSLTADGDPLGELGCVSPLDVAPRLHDYKRSDDEAGVPWADGSRSRWKAATYPFAILTAARGWTFALLAIAGYLGAASLPPVRRWVRKNWKIGGLIAVFLFLLELTLLVGVGGILLGAQLLGIVLLLISIWLLLTAGGTHLGSYGWGPPQELNPEPPKAP